MSSKKELSAVNNGINKMLGRSRQYSSKRHGAAALQNLAEIRTVGRARQHRGVRQPHAALRQDVRHYLNSTLNGWKRSNTPVHFGGRRGRYSAFPGGRTPSDR
jgi:hypothetical protein